MADPPDIFARRRLTVGQLRAVADRRFGDAEALVATGDNARANGAQYLAGMVLEILLKGKLLQTFPLTSAPDTTGLSARNRERWQLVWRSHDLAAMLDELPSLKVAVDDAGRRAGRPYLSWLSALCARWTIHARYSPSTSTIADARAMLERVRLLKEVVR